MQDLFKEYRNFPGIYNKLSDKRILNETIVKSLRILFNACKIPTVYRFENSGYTVEFVMEASNISLDKSILRVNSIDDNVFFEIDLRKIKSVQGFITILLNNNTKLKVYSDA